MRMHATTAALALVVALASAGAASAGPFRSITVFGNGTVTTVPTQAQFELGVSTTSATAQEALGANAARMTRVIAAIERLGVRPAELQTSQVSLTPNTNSSGTRIVNYTAADQLTATTDDVAHSGGIVDGAVGAGANLVSGPTLSPTDEQLLSERALAAAVSNARSLAGAIAAAAGVRLGAVESVTVESNSTPIVPAFASSASAHAPTPIEAGTVETQEEVSVTFAIAP